MLSKKKKKEKSTPTSLIPISPTPIFNMWRPSLITISSKSSPKNSLMKVVIVSSSIKSMAPNNALIVSQTKKKKKGNREELSSLQKYLGYIRQNHTGHKSDVPYINTIQQQINKQFEELPQMRKCDKSRYTVDYIGFIKSKGIQPAHMDLVNPNAMPQNPKNKKLPKLAPEQWTLPVQGIISLTEGEDDTILYDTTGVPSIPTCEDLFHFWKTNGEPPSQTLMSIIRNNRYIQQQIAKWGHLMYTSAVCRPSPKPLPKMKMSLLHGSRPHCGPHPNNGRIILFLTASRKYPPYSSILAKSASSDSTYNNTQMSFEKLMWHITDECMTDLKALSYEECTELREYLLESFAKAIASSATLGAFDKTLENFKECKIPGPMMDLMQHLQAAGFAFADEPSHENKWKVTKFIKLIASHEDTFQRLNNVKGRHSIMNQLQVS